MGIRTYQNEPRLKEIRRFLRSEANTAEQILWKYIRNKQLGHKFRRQFSIGNFVVDFYCHEFCLVIEVDGWSHDFEKTKVKDIRKQNFLESHRYHILRIPNEEVFGDIEKLLTKIQDTCTSLARLFQPHPLSLPL